MNRRFLLGAAAGLAAWPMTAQAQVGLSLRPITPQNALETAFLAALNSAAARPNFRHVLVSSQVALALATAAPDSPPLFVDVAPAQSGGRPFNAGAIFTSAARLTSVLGDNAPKVILTGRAALERLGGHNVVLNFRLLPMLTLEAADVASYLTA